MVRDAPSNASPARTALPAAHFERNGVTNYMRDGTLDATDLVLPKVTLQT
jgi:hypothetical protein